MYCTLHCTNTLTRIVVYTQKQTVHNNRHRALPEMSDLI